MLVFLCANFQTTQSRFKESDFSVVRQHEEFVWLHDRFVENEEYAGVIVSYKVFLQKYGTFLQVYSVLGHFLVN